MLAVIWVAVLVPPVLRARAERRPSGSITDFRWRLRVLARSAPVTAVSLRAARRTEALVIDLRG
ncbi:MAG: hypothetical protein ACRD0D_07140, partial [Acidimicrobiales bacterium]